MPRLSTLADQKPQLYTYRLCAVYCKSEQYVRQGETATELAGKVVQTRAMIRKPLIAPAMTL